MSNLKVNVIKPKVYLSRDIDVVKELLKCASVARTSRGKRVSYELFGEVIGAPGDDYKVHQSIRGLEFLESLLKKDPPHESVLYHSALRIDFIVSRIATHQMVRHKHAEWMQESTRYVPIKNEVTFIKPMSVYDDIIGNHKATIVSDGSIVVHPGGIDDDWLEYASAGVFSYIREVESKYLSREDARYLLPHCIASKIACTANLAQWRTMVIKRTHKRASPEMRYIFNKVGEFLSSVFEPLMIGWS